MGRAAGLRDLSARCLRSRNKMNVVKATYAALMSQRIPEQVALARGRKMVDVRNVYYSGRATPPLNKDEKEEKRRYEEIVEQDKKERFGEGSGRPSGRRESVDDESRNLARGQRLLAQRENMSPEGFEDATKELNKDEGKRRIDSPTRGLNRRLHLGGSSGGYRPQQSL